MKRYRLLHRIAVGGMGEVFLARSEGPHGFAKTVVIKRILSHLATEAQFVEMFLNEARLAALLSHPNIVQIHELGEEDGVWFIVMEYIHGRTLRAIRRELLQKRQVVTPVFAARVCSLALQGLHYAHTLTDDDGQLLHVVHRDVSADNILVGFNGQVKVVDFGIAKAANAVPTTRTGTVKGKFSYMAPEQLLGEPVDARTDVYSMGVILFELLTGGRPWVESTDPALIHSILNKPAPVPIERNPALPEAMSALILRALAKDPAERFQSAEEMSLELERFLLDSGHQLTTSQVGTFLQELFGPEASALPGASSGQGTGAANRPDRVASTAPSSPGRIDPGSVVLTTPVSTGARQRVRELVSASAPSGAPTPSHPQVPAVDYPPTAVVEAATTVEPRPTADPRASAETRPLTATSSAPSEAASLLRRRLTWGGLALLFLAGLVGAYAAGRGGSAPPRPPEELTPVGTLAAVEEKGAADDAASEPDKEAAEALGSDEPPDNEAVRALAAGTTTPEVIPAAAKAASASDEGAKTPEPTPRAEPSQRVVASAEPRQRRARTEAPSRPRATSQAQGEGKVALRISPWAEVLHGGKSLGITPMAAVTVPSGRQTFTLRNTDLGVTRRVTVTVPVNGEVVLRADLFDAP